MTKEERLIWLKQYVSDGMEEEIYEAIYNEGYLDAAALAIDVCKDSEDKDAKLCVKTFKDFIELNNVYSSN